MQLANPSIDKKNIIITNYKNGITLFIQIVKNLFTYILLFNAQST